MSFGGNIADKVSSSEAVSAMKISVVGTINNDTIVSLEGAKTESLGGIIYNTVALAVLCPDDTIIPVAYYGTDCADRLMSLLTRFSNIDPSGLVEWKNGCNQNLLKYVSGDSREEILKIRVPSIDSDMLKTCSSSDFVLVNFISGFDMELDTLKNLREIFKGTIYMDVHSLTLGIDGEGARFERIVEGWTEWAVCADIIQMNRKEARLFAGVSTSVENVSRMICSEGPKVCLITLGKDGVLITRSTPEGSIQTRIEGVSVDVKDTTGCGDVFSAAYICARNQGCDPIESARQANLTAARSCECVGLESLKEAIH